MSEPCKRILLKLSGEAIMGNQPYGINYDAAKSWADRIAELVSQGIEVGCVIGAGNIFRGLQGEKFGFEKTPADHMGMLATMINGIALEQALLKAGVRAILMSAVNCHPIAEPYNWQHALHHLEQKRPVIFVGGTGSPYFTTDTAAALRASEIKADILLKATKVDGVYSKDPLKYKDAVRYPTLSYAEFLAQKLGVCDATAVALAMSNKIPILVFDMNVSSIFDVLNNKSLGTLIN